MKWQLIFIGVFLGLGLFTGSLFRNVGLYKALAIYFIFPYILILVSSLNIWNATIPYLIGAFFAYFRKPKH